MSLSAFSGMGARIKFFVVMIKKVTEKMNLRNAR